MLKREDSKEILEGVKIKMPSIEETNKLIKKVNKLSKTESGEINWDDPKVIYVLFKALVVSDKKEIKNISEFDFMEAYYDPTQEMEIICFEIGKVMSNAIMSFMRKNIAVLMETEMKMLQAEALVKLESINESVKEIEKNKKNNK